MCLDVDGRAGAPIAMSGDTFSCGWWTVSTFEYVGGVSLGALFAFCPSCPFALPPPLPAVSVGTVADRKRGEVVIGIVCGGWGGECRRFVTGQQSNGIRMRKQSI